MNEKNKTKKRKSLLFVCVCLLKKKRVCTHLFPASSYHFLPRSNAIQCRSHAVCDAPIELLFRSHAAEVHVLIRSQLGEDGPHGETERVHITPLVVRTAEHLCDDDLCVRKNECERTKVREQDIVMDDG